jgi:transcriptional regulator with XRE-family HTH domain
VQIPPPVKALIVGRGFRQCDGAVAIGINPQISSRVLNRRVEPWPALRRRLSDYLDAPEDELFDDDAVAA